MINGDYKLLVLDESKMITKYLLRNLNAIRAAIKLHSVYSIQSILCNLGRRSLRTN